MLISPSLTHAATFNLIIENKNKNFKQKCIVLHELGHALGLWHEQSRLDRDEYVEILNDNIKPGHEHNFKHRSNNVINDYGVAYDYNSIMHYGKTVS